MSEGGQETKETRKLVIDDPQKFFEKFFESDEYKQAYETRRAKMKPSTETTEEDINDVILNSDEVKLAFFDFAQYKVTFRYNPNFFPETSRKTVKNYIETVYSYRRVFQGLGPDVEENQQLIKYIDTERSKAHETAALILFKEEVAPSERLGKGLVSLILIGRGLETFSKASEADIRRAQRKIGITGF